MQYKKVLPIPMGQNELLGTLKASLSPRTPSNFFLCLRYYEILVKALCFDSFVHNQAISIMKNYCRRRFTKVFFFRMKFKFTGKRSMTLNYNHLTNFHAMRDMSSAVSYTHLDVYRRQKTHCNQRWDRSCQVLVNG